MYAGMHTKLRDGTQNPTTSAASAPDSTLQAAPQYRSAGSLTDRVSISESSAVRRIAPVWVNRPTILASVLLGINPHLNDDEVAII